METIRRKIDGNHQLRDSGTKGLMPLGFSVTGERVVKVSDALRSVSRLAYPSQSLAAALV